MVELNGSNTNTMPFTKGQSGNPQGRPKGIPKLSLTQDIVKYFKAHPKEYQAVVLALIASMKRGSFQAILELWNRIDGKVTEKHEIEGKIPVTLVFKPATPEAIGQGHDSQVIDSPEVKQIGQGDTNDG